MHPLGDSPGGPRQQGRCSFGRKESDACALGMHHRHGALVVATWKRLPSRGKLAPAQQRRGDHEEIIMLRAISCFTVPRAMMVVPGRGSGRGSVVAMIARRSVVVVVVHCAARLLRLGLRRRLVFFNGGPTLRRLRIRTWEGERGGRDRKFMTVAVSNDVQHVVVHAR